MDTNQLAAFLAVAEHHSFTLAAEKLHLTQPAISKRVTALEQTLGNRLFDRIGKRVILTEAGQVLAGRARKILREFEDTRNALQNLSLTVAGRLSLASSHHIGLHRLPPVLKEFAGRHPAVAMDVSFLDSEVAYDRVARGDIELAVVTLASDGTERIASHALWTDELMIMTSTDHSLTRYKNVKLDDLLDFPAILPGRNTFTRQLVEQLFEDRRVKLEVEMSTNYLETIKMMVSVGMAWSILPATMADRALKVLPVRDFKLSRQLGYIYHKDHTLSNAASAFIRILHRYAG